METVTCVLVLTAITVKLKSKYVRILPTLICSSFISYPPPSQHNVWAKCEPSGAETPLLPLISSQQTNRGSLAFLHPFIWQQHAIDQHVSTQPAPSFCEELALHLKLEQFSEGGRHMAASVGVALSPSSAHQCAMRKAE